MPCTRLCLRLAALSLALLMPSAWGLVEDRDQPIEITADRALRDDTRGYTVYNGDVRLTQGSLVIEADRITLFHNSGSADRVVAEGQPARMQQVQNPGEEPMKARALRIIYLVEAERVQLRQQARVEQDGATLEGDSIDYLIPQQIVRADTESGSGGRVQVVIPAARVNSEETSTDENEKENKGGGNGDAESE
jgi:lipopolysaccharide export system protein LptA